MRKNKISAKIAEICLASGIPVVALAKFADDGGAFIAAIPLLLAIVAAGGWHIKTLNDNCERRGGEGKLSAGLALPLLILPFLVFLEPGTAVPVILIILNWDFYSIFGKNRFAFSILNNFLGGFLHFALGATAGGSAFFDAASSPEAFFFGFAMLCGSMHHDAYHAKEDEARNSITGAVRFGPDIWWRLAVFPMTISLFFLTQSEAVFSHFFIFLAVAPYLIGYFAILASSPSPSKKIFFRLFCRLSFAFSATGYILLKIFFE